MEFEPLQLPDPPRFHPQQLIELAKQQKIPILDHSLLVKAKLDAIANGQANQLTFVDWLICIPYKAQWDQENPQQSQATSAKVWQIALEQTDLQAYLLRRLALYHSDRDAGFLAASLVQTFSIFEKAAQGHAQFLATVIRALAAEDPQYAIVELSCTHNLTQQELFDQLGYAIPTTIPAIKQAPERIAAYFAKHAEPTKAAWLLRYLTAMNDAAQLQVVESLLLHLPPKTGTQLPKLAKWLEKNYGWRGDHSRWHQLSENAQVALRKWIGTIHYGDFQQIINHLLSSQILPDWQRNQLKRRRDFWSNYSDRFERLRVLLPPSSVKALGYQNFQKVDTLLDTAAETTEVCIFDFGRWYIVEFFRGSGSETRLFDKHKYPKLEHVFFGIQPLSLGCLRCQGGEFHDHAFLWQGYCERWLRERGIYPNDDVTHFKGLSEVHGYYHPEHGLPRPSPTEEQERKLKLEHWAENMQRLEKQYQSCCGRFAL